MLKYALLDIKNGCAPSTNIGVFLLFPKFREFCEEQGFIDFGPFGAGDTDRDEEWNQNLIIFLQTLLSSDLVKMLA